MSTKFSKLIKILATIIALLIVVHLLPLSMAILGKTAQAAGLAWEAGPGEILVTTPQNCEAS